MFYSFDNPEDFKVIKNIPNDDLCQLHHIKIIPIANLLDVELESIHMPRYDSISKIILNQKMTPCNCDTFLKVYKLQQFLEKSFWPKDDHCLINFLGSTLKAGYVKMQGQPYAANLFGALGVGPGRRSGLLRIQDNYINPFTDYVAVYET